MYEDDDILEQREVKARLLRKRRVDDVRAQMGSQPGRRFVWALLLATKYESRLPLFDTHGGRQSYLIGAYDVGRTLSEEIRDLCPEQYLLMVRENTQQPDEVTQ
jgi:hypothetical protein